MTFNYIVKIRAKDAVILLFSKAINSIDWKSKSDRNSEKNLIMITMTLCVFGIHISFIFFPSLAPKAVYVYNDMCSTEQHYDARKNVPSAEEKKPPRHKVRIKPKWVVNAVVCEKVNESKISHNKRRVKQKPAGCLRQLCAVCIHTFCLANACGDNLVLTHYFSKWKKNERRKCDCFVGCSIIIVVIGKFCMVFVLLVSGVSLSLGSLN